MQSSAGENIYTGYYELSTYIHEDLDNVGKEIHVIIGCLKGGGNYIWLTLFRHPGHSVEMFVCTQHTEKGVIHS